MAKKKYTEKEIEIMASKAEKWDKLEDTIGKFYGDGDDEEAEEGDLLDIGEAAAMAFGFL